MIKSKPTFMNDSVYKKLLVHTAPQHLTNFCLVECDPCHSEAEIVVAFDEFAKGHTLVGDSQDTGAEMLGHIKPKTLIVERIARILLQDEKTVSLHLDALGGKGTKGDQEDARIWFEDEIASQKTNDDLNLARNPTWFFRGEAGERPFHGDCACLPWQLGLPSWTLVDPSLGLSAEVECLAFEIDGATVGDVSLPTAFDAGYQWTIDFWIPGGLTQPLAGSPPRCLAAAGKREVVSSPAHLSDVQLPITTFKSAIA